MKIIVEIDTDEELQRVERFLKFLDPSVVRVNGQNNAHKLQDFLEFIKKEAPMVEKIIIPNREERHAR